MTIAVTGISGALGSAILRALKKRLEVERIIGVARAPGRVKDLGVEVRRGDYGDRAQFEAALQGVEVVLLVSGNDYPEQRKTQHANVIDAAKAVGVGKLVYVSILGLSSGTSFSPIVASNRHTEEYLTQSGLDWVIGRNGIYIEPDIESVSEYRSAGRIVNSAGDGACGYVTRDELAVAYAEMLINPKHNSRIYNLTGEAITQTKLAMYLNRTFDLELTYQSISVEDYLQDRITAFGEYAGKIVGGIYQNIRMGAFDVESHFAEAAGRAHIGWGEYFKGVKSRQNNTQAGQSDTE